MRRDIRLGAFVILFVAIPLGTLAASPPSPSRFIAPVVTGTS